MDLTAEAEALLALALERPAADRDAFLDAACGDRDLRDELGALLLHATSDPDFLHSPLLPLERPGDANEPRGTATGQSADGSPGFLRLPRHIGGYPILGVLGYGGMGVVYESRQSHPERSIAIKLPGLSPVGPELLLRFAREVELLGRLRHPGIVQLFGIGQHQLTERGGLPYKLPFMIMELVRGERLDRYIAESAPGLADRLSLFAAICDAVHFAHQRGVIHRDLKPANILVQDNGEPKLLDFGVALASDTNAGDRARLTEDGELVGSLAYMGPEQLGGDPRAVDSRSDIYALGAILFGMLTGRPPFEVGHLSHLAAADLIRSRQDAFLISLSRTLDRGLAAVVGRAMAKDRERRYRSAAELAADVRRCQRRQRATVRSTSLWDRLRRLAGLASLATLQALRGFRGRSRLID